MKVVVQRSKAAQVTVNGKIIGQIDHGLVLLVGITHDDQEQDAIWLAEKIAGLRIFEDEHGKMNHSVQDVKGSILSISQFTLFGDCRKGKRPNFMEAAKPEHAKQLYEKFNEALRLRGLRVEVGEFGSMMEVSLTNSGPVTMIIDSRY